MQKLHYIIHELRSALKGDERDYTSGSVHKAIFLLSVPMILEMIMESAFAVVDIYFVSRISSQAVTTVGITESLIVAIIFTICMGYAMATTALVARRIGEKNEEQASVVAVQAIILGLITAVLIAVPGALFAPELLSLMGAEELIVRDMSNYTRIMFAGNGIIMLLFIINAVFRGAGDAVIAMKVLWLANGINIILDPLFIFGYGPFPELGVTGAAVATNIGRGLGVLYQLYILFGKKRKISIALKQFTLKLPVIKKLLKLSLGTIGQYFIATASWLGLVRIVSFFGSDIFAGYQIAIRIFIFSLLPSWGISNAAATLVGQNLGAGNPDRAEQTSWIVAKVNMLLMLLITLLFLLLPHQLIGAFSLNPIVLKAGVECLQIMGLGMIFYGMGMVLVNSFNGAGDTFTPTWINVIAFWLIEIPLAYFLSFEFELRERGVFISIVVAESVMTLIAFFVFRKGKWKLREV